MLTGYLAAYGYIALLLGLATGARRYTRMSHELIRKLVHVALCLVWVILYHYFAGSWQIVVVPATLIAANALSYRFNLVKAIERDDGNKNPGTVYFAVAVTALFALTLIFPGTLKHSALAVFALTFGDGFASIAGTLAPKRHPLWGRKSVEGVAGCFVAAFFGMWLGALFAGLPVRPFMLLVLALAASVLEFLGGDYDNFTITLGVYALAVWFYGG